MIQLDDNVIKLNECVYLFQDHARDVQPLIFEIKTTKSFRLASEPAVSQPLHHG